MSVATFLAKADALKAKGLGALGSPDIKLLRRSRMRRQNLSRTIAADKKAGRTPHSCPPKKAALNSDQLLPICAPIPPPSDPRQR
jgi:hypothetical protein